MRTEQINTNNHSKSQQLSNKQKQVKEMQSDFLIQLSEGIDEKEAFYNSIKNAARKNNQQEDYFLSSHTKSTDEIKAKFQMSPAEAKEWLEVIAMIGPIVVQFFDWVDSKLPKKEQTQTASV